MIEHNSRTQYTQHVVHGNHVRFFFFLILGSGHYGRGKRQIGSKPAAAVVADIERLCSKLHNESPSATLLVSEVLPRSHNLFPGNQTKQYHLDRWNHDAGMVNRNLRSLAKMVSWLQVIEQPEFHTMFGKFHSCLQAKCFLVNIKDPGLIMPAATFSIMNT
ncbi:uncharacterized protein LOC128558258 [Mercenaria mercenaria]|uniref:uncharacterized protein LOC128558258 n=1 Tax=Mercenaria mercenaria TaxID=6596 RepID=UPI00234FB513|nr:uncharacterized protein LOC128558258 [Mercenaria mercenaria]